MVKHHFRENGMYNVLSTVSYLFRRCGPCLLRDQKNAIHAISSSSLSLWKVTGLRCMENVSVLLDEVCNQRRNDGDEALGDASFTQKGLRNFPLGKVDSLNANERFPHVFHRLKPFHFMQIHIIKVGMSYFSIAEIGSTKMGLTEVGVKKVGLTQINVTEDGLDESSSTQEGIPKVGMTKICPGQISFGEIGTDQDSLAEISSDEISSAEIGSTKISLSKIGLAEVRLAEIDIAEGWPNLWMVPSPCIPNLVSLQEIVKMFLVCQVPRLLGSALIL